MRRAYGESLPEPYRAAAGDAGPADPADAAVGSAARLRDKPGHSGELRRPPAGRHRLAVSRAASPGAAKVDRSGLEGFGQQTARARVSPDREGQTPTSQ